MRPVHEAHSVCLLFSFSLLGCLSLLFSVCLLLVSGVMVWPTWGVFTDVLVYENINEMVGMYYFELFLQLHRCIEIIEL